MQLRAYLLTLLSLLSFSCLGVGAQKMTEQCAYDLFPTFVGGVTGSEKIGCFLYDEKNDIILLGGNTTSDDFAPATNNHGFLLAIDSNSNWLWGNFFYNVSYPISDIYGCSISSDGNSLAVIAMGNSQPVIMNINPFDGVINTFISIEFESRTDDNIPEYAVDGAIYNDVLDYQDQQDYFYTAFTMNDTLHMIRVRNGDEPEIDWDFEITDIDSTQDADDMIRRKDASFIHPDPRDNTALYMTGRIRGKGSVARFQKRDATIRWWAQFKELTKIYGWAHGTTDDNLFVAGDYQPNEASTLAIPDTPPYIDSEYKCGIARLNDDGEVRWFIRIDGDNPSYDAALGINNQDRCRGITYDEASGEIAVIVQIKMYQLRDENKGNFYDNLLVVLDLTGEVQNAVTISQGDLSYDMYAAGQGLFRKGDDFFWAGWSNGFKTYRNKLEADADEPKTDAFIYRYQFDRDQYQCLIQLEHSVQAVERRMTFFSRSSVESEDLVEVTKRGSQIFSTTAKRDYFIPYLSRYSGGFVLADTFRIPRPCAYKSENMTSIQYYRGQKNLTYNIFDKNPATPLTLMENPVITYQTGETCEDLAFLNTKDNEVSIQTDAEDKVGVQKVLIRDCTAMSKLLELNLYIDVLSNNYPDFIEEPQTSWTMAVGDVVSYKLPSVVDPEGNDEPEVYIGYMDAQEEKYPPFLMFENATNTLSFLPNSKWVSGRQYYFTIVVKEANSDSVKYAFYCTVRVTGEVFEQNTTVETIWINYNITYIDEAGKGAMQFDNDVNMTYIEENFGEIFRVFWRDTDYKINKQERPLSAFDIMDFGGEDNRTIKFWIEFEKPYKIGLLLKRSDKLYITVADGIDYENLFVTNKTITKLNTTSDWIRLELIFDFRNNEMFLMRQIAKNMYWVLIAVILLQFILLTLRRVGLLPVWVFIEYLQLVGFMPIYNFRLIPYLYDAFKPSLVAHMIIFDETPGMPELDKEYFNANYKHYWLSVGRLAQAFFFCIILLFLILIANFVTFVIYKASSGNSSLHKWAEKKMVQFKFNAYIRYYMLAYFDTTFFSIMKIMDPNNSTTARKAALLLSYILFVLAIIIPVILIAHLNRRFEILSLKEAKQGFNTLILKIDKGSRWRVMNPAYFFARRLLTAMLLTLPIDNTFIFLQYVFILMSSHAYILYMVACKPYQTPSINSYVLANETFYSALIIAIFIFSDATPEQPIKFGAGVALMVSLVLLVLCNFVMNIVYLIQGPNTIKKAIKESNLKRAEKEALERAEEEERKLKKKKEEEEFTKIPDDTMNISGMEGSNAGNVGMGMSDNGPSGGSKKRKGKKKGQEDNVVEPNSMGSDGFSNPPQTKKKRRGKGKDSEKGKGGDDVVEGTVDSGPSKSKSRRKTNQDTVHGTDFGTNPTKGEFI